MAYADNEIIYDDDPFGDSGIIYDADPFKDDSIIYDDDPFQDNEAIRAGTIPAPGGGTEVSDYLKVLGKGAVGTAELAALAGQAIVSSPGSPLGPVSKTIGDVLSDPRGLGRSETARRIGQTVKYPLAQAIPPLREMGKGIEESLSPAMKAEREKKFIRKAEPGETHIAGYRPGPGFTSVPKIAGMAVESIPMTVAGMGAGAGIATGLKAAGLSRGVASIVGFGIGEGVTAGGSNGIETYYQVIETDDKKLEKSNVYKRILENQPKDLPEEQRRAAAKRTLALSAASMVGVSTAVTTGILGAPSGYVAGRLLFGPGNKAAVPLWQNLLLESLSEGLVEEMPQSAVEQTINNLVTRTLSDPNQPIFEGVGEAAIGGALTGMAMGGGMGAGFAVAGRKARQADQAIDITEGTTDSQQDAFIAQMKQDFGTGDVTVKDLQEFATRFPRGSKVVQEINKLIKQDAILREPVIDLLDKATPDQVDRETDRETGRLRPRMGMDYAGIPMPGAYPPLAYKRASESAIPLQEDAYFQEAETQFGRQETLVEEGLQSEQIAQEEGVEREMIHREAAMPDAGVRLGEKLGEVEAEEAIRGLGGLAGYMKDLLKQVKAGRPGGKVQLKDAVGPGEEWIGFASTYPDFMKDKYGGVKVIDSLEKGLSGRPFEPRETKMKAIWEDALEAAREVATRDAIEYAKLVEEEPETIGELEQQDYLELLEVLNAEGYSTRSIEEAASRFRAPIHSRAITAIAGELGISEEEINALINDPNQPIDIDDVWSSATSEELTEFEQAQEEFDRDRQTREGMVRGEREARQEGEPEEPGRPLPEPRPGGEAPRTGGILQEEGEVQIGQAAPEVVEEEDTEGERLAGDFNEKYPGSDIVYDGEWERPPGVKMEPVYTFTPHAGIIKKSTFTIRKLTLPALLEGFNKKVKDFVKPGEMLLRDKDGVIYRDKGPTHAHTMDAFNLDPDNIEAVGIVDKDGNLIWQEPKPDQLEKPEEYKEAAADQKAKEKAPAPEKVDNMAAWQTATAKIESYNALLECMG